MSSGGGGVGVAAPCGFEPGLVATMHAAARSVPTEAVGAPDSGLIEASECEMSASDPLRRPRKKDSDGSGDKISEPNAGLIGVRSDAKNLSVCLR